MWGISMKRDADGIRRKKQASSAKLLAKNFIILL